MESRLQIFVPACQNAPKLEEVRKRFIRRASRSGAVDLRTRVDYLSEQDLKTRVAALCKQLRAAKFKHLVVASTLACQRERTMTLTFGSVGRVKQKHAMESSL